MTSQKTTGTQRLPAEAAIGRILAAAADLFMNQGFAATTVRQIGEAAGVGQSSLYYHFESKAHILRALHERFMTVMLERLAAHAGSGESATDQLKGMIGVVLHIVETHQAEVTVYLREGHALPAQLRETVIERRDRADQMFDEVLTRGVANGEFRPDLDVHLTRLAILGACNWSYQWFRPKRMSGEEIGRYFADLLVRGVAL